MEDLFYFYPPIDLIGGGGRGTTHLNGKNPPSTDQQAVDMNFL